MDEDGQKLKDNSKEVEIDPDIYEYLAVLGMKLGHDNVNDFINDLLLFELRRLEEEEGGEDENIQPTIRKRYNIKISEMMKTGS